MTVKETLDFQVELKMGAVLKAKEERDARVDDLIDQLGLKKSANTIVGNAKVRGLSGGERKRLSIACSMISSPQVIFLVSLIRVYILSTMLSIHYAHSHFI